MRTSYRIILAGIVSMATAPALAGDDIHADSFGNLVIHGSSGYKRIIVGAGHLAGRFVTDRARPVHSGDPYVVYLDEDRQDSRLDRSRPCSRQPVVLHGRGYMYGLDRGTVAVPVRTCE